MNVGNDLSVKLSNEVVITPVLSGEEGPNTVLFMDEGFHTGNDNVHTERHH